MKSLGNAGYFPVKLLSSLSGLQTLIFSTFPAITYTKYERFVLYSCH